MNDVYFPDLIGQTEAKKILGFYLDSYRNSNIFPHLLLLAPKGAGKTEFAKQTGRLLRDMYKGEERKDVLVIDSAGVKSPEFFIENIVIPKVRDKPVTLIFDESHELNEKVTTALLTILNTTKDNKTTYRYGDSVFEFDFRHVSFLFATTERQKMFEPLIDRMTQVSLVDYDNEEIAGIMRLNVDPDFTVDDDALLELSAHSRGNGRDAAKLGGQEGISSFLSACNQKHFTKAHVAKLVDILGRFRLGLDRSEINILKMIVNNRESSLTQIASQSGLTRSAQQDKERYLLKHNLIKIETSKRKPTHLGYEYLRMLKLERGV